MRDSLKDKKYFEERYAKDSAWLEETINDCNKALLQKDDRFSFVGYYDSIERG